MASMRAEAVDMIYGLSDEDFSEALRYLKRMSQRVKKSEEEEQRERELAFERLEQYTKENKKIYGDNFDWKKEYLEAISEKYGVVN